MAAEEIPADVHLWPNGAPGFENRANEKEVVTMREEPDTAPFPVTSNIQNPSITPFLPPAGKGPTAAVIVAPGGAHRFLTIGREGNDVGKFLQAHGIAAFVLKYRLAREPNSVYKVEVHALQDAQRAIRLIRSRAKDWNINPDQVGILGFSAGGEVAALAAMHPDKGIAGAADPVDRLPSGPNFQALIYPGSSSNVTVSSESPPAFLVCRVRRPARYFAGASQCLFEVQAGPCPRRITYLYARRTRLRRSGSAAGGLQLAVPVL